MESRARIGDLKPHALFGTSFPLSRVLMLVLAIAGTGIAMTRIHWGTLLLPQASPGGDERRSNDPHRHAEIVKGLVLSDVAKASLCLEFGPVVLQEYWRSVTVPAEVMEEPGHCEQGVASTVNGIVLKIHAFHGQTVKTGDPLFTLRPTSELLASAQTALLRSVQEIELVQAELKRIASITESGGIPAVRRIDKENELKRLDSQRLLQMQELLVRGLSRDQVGEIVRTKTLIQELTIRVPTGRFAADSVAEISNPKDAVNADDDGQISASPLGDSTNHEHGSVYSIEQLNVHLGKLIQPGEELCHLARHSQLQIVGRAFERESFLVTRAIEQNWPVKAVFEATDDSPLIRDNLFILYSDNVIEPNSRTLRFYIPLPNELVRDKPSTNGLSYRSWRFKPGQRASVLLPVEHLVRQIVLPAEAIVKEGAEAFVFRVNGKRLDRISVQLQHVDSRNALIKPGGVLAVGDVVARNHAYLLQLALKNAQGGHGGSHAGHDHAGHVH